MSSSRWVRYSIQFINAQKTSSTKLEAAAIGASVTGVKIVYLINSGQIQINIKNLITNRYANSVF